jgi:SAM-dependent methyltransferase
VLDVASGGRKQNREVWESLGREDPDWAVLTDPARRGGGWSQDLDTFYASGQAEIAEVLAELPVHDGSPRERAMDWGSGTGRLTFALAAHYPQVTAVDVSDAMLATLGVRAAARGVEGVHGVRVDELVPAADHDLVVSLLVLQHLPDEAAVLAALRTMVACLRVGGHAVVEVPDRPLTRKARSQPRYHAYRALRLVGVRPAWLHSHGLSGISMVTLPQALVRRTLEEAGATVEAVSDVRPGDGYRYLRYRARRAH